VRGELTRRAKSSAARTHATDVLGANRNGFDALFVAAGIHGAELRDRAQLDRARVAAALAAEGVHARYAMPELA
jgi:ribonucleotide monophosphatase NagD (HAD superfamily)